MVGLEGLPEMMRVMINEAMRMERENYLGAKPYEHSEDRQGHANAASPRQSRPGWACAGKRPKISAPSSIPQTGKLPGSI